MKCIVCEREVPSQEYLTGKGCIWCDWDYWYKKQQVEETASQKEKL